MADSPGSPAPTYMALQRQLSEQPVTRTTRVRFWRSPPGQPKWARPALLAIAALAALAYGYGMGTVTLEPFYGGAARSMSENWHNFIFGAFDPWGTVSVDKLPGALWVQALSIQAFGFHLWAIVLPQVVEGTLTVLVLYRAVRQVAGPEAGLVAALALAVSPVTILLNRGNISDSLLILLLVLAADATTKALTTGGLRSLLLAGLWVGLAFQAKMLQAWLVLPALYLAYLIAAPAASLVRRFWHVALSALVVVVVSLSWMTAVSAVPAHDRPYVDGSCDNSLFSQVFLYNGLDRISDHELDQSGCSKPSAYLVEASVRGASLGVGTFAIPSGWDRLLRGVFGRDDAWLLVPSVVAAGGLLVRRRRRPRTDPIRAATVLWATWLVLTGVLFSQGQYLNSYYLAALLPPMGALCGLGAATAWRHRRSVTVRAVVLATVVASTGYAVSLIPTNAGVQPWVIGSTVVLAVLAAAVLGASLWHRPASVWTSTVGLVLATAALLISSAWASATVLVTGEGPFDSPYQPAHVTYLSQTLPSRNKLEWPALDAFARSVPRHQAADVLEASAVAGYYIMVTGHEFLSVGGFTGRVPAPSLTQFIRFVAEGKVVRAQAAISPLTNNPDLHWVMAHCPRQTFGEPVFRDNGTTFQRYLCSPSDARGGRLSPGTLPVRRAGLVRGGRHGGAVPR